MRRGNESAVETIGLCRKNKFRHANMQRSDAAIDLLRNAKFGGKSLVTATRDQPNTTVPQEQIQKRPRSSATTCRLDIKSRLENRSNRGTSFSTLVLPRCGRKHLVRTGPFTQIAVGASSNLEHALVPQTRRSKCDRAVQTNGVCPQTKVAGQAKPAYLATG